MPITSIIRASTAADGTQGNDESLFPVFSPDGTKLLLWSYASNLVAGDTNGSSDIFVKDLATGAIKLVSTDAAGVQGNDGSYEPDFSPDGTKVAFYSSASNLDGHDSNGVPDIFVKTLETGAIKCISTAAAGTRWNDTSYDPKFSPDGTKVAFASYASNVVPGDTNSTASIFVKDLTNETVCFVSTNAAGEHGNGFSADPAFSPDGTKVAFRSSASNLVPGDTNENSDIFVKTLAAGAISLVSTAANGTQGNGGSYDPIFSPDGTKMAFRSDASNLVPGDSNGSPDIFIKTLATGAIARISTDAAGAQANGGSGELVFSPDGTKVAFRSDASNLVAGDTNNRADIFVKVLATGAIERISTDAMGVQGNGSSYEPVFSPDGTKVAFRSDASNFVAGDTNGAPDIFVVTLATPPTTVFHDISDNTNRSQFKAAFAGSDSIDGTGGADRIRGWAGRDTILGEGGNDEIRGDGVGLPYDPDLPDTDPVKFADSIQAGAGNDSVWGGGGNDTLLGEDGSDRLYGQGGGDSIDGGRGADEINGAENNDTCRGGADNDWIAGGPGLDSLYGDDGNDKIYAFAPDSEASRWGWIDDGTGDQIEGGNGNDTLIGGKGIDTLTGGAGRDSMSGSSGDDIFRYGAASETGNSLTTCDIITDFAPGHDKIDLRDIDANSVLAGNNAFVLRGTGPFTTSSEGELRYQKYDNAGTANDYTVIFGDTDADTASEFQIKLQGLVTLSQADFIL
ncbi:MAG: M10 family metallopeptidase C-terminal domain-containing protein [Defluviicoccus sp.]|nr:M10 family metallopeptidase C-terminal domain-containing protein [Defluviicoccus sp.]